jgi:hypothetical protein
LLEGYSRLNGRAATGSVAVLPEGAKGVKAASLAKAPLVKTT